MDTLFENYIKVAKVNLYTGEYHFVKFLDTPMEKICLQADTIDGYASLILKNNLVHPQDREDFGRHMDIAYLRERIQGNSREISHSFRRCIHGIFEWITLEVVAPKDFSRENPWVVITWKYSDTSSCMMEDSLRMLSFIYYKILKINLTQDTYEIIKATDEQGISMSNPPKSVSQWFRLFVEYKNLAPEDEEEYKSFTDMEALRVRFRSSRECIRFRYRRKIGEDFRWVCMEILPGIEYTDENQVVMLYIKDIHDDYVAEVQRQRELEYYCNYDVLAGIWNRNYYNQVCDSYVENGRRGQAGALFADMNRLKYINDHFGHEAGDDYIRQFAGHLSEAFGKNNCFRISGDEFVVLLPEIDREEFRAKTREFYCFLQRRPDPVASIGCCWQECVERLEKVVNGAEAAMYKDKRRFYELNPQFRR